MIIITGTILTKPANCDEIRALCIEHSARSREEPGCIVHDVHSNCEQPDRLFFYEQWQDEASVVAHFRVPESRKFVAQVTELAGYRPAIQIFSAEQVSPEQL